MISITQQIKKLIFKIKESHGHDFLYKDYDDLIKTLEQEEQLSPDECNDLNKLIATLLSEAETYSSCNTYTLWAVRCLECASGFIAYLPKGHTSTDLLTRCIQELIHKFTTTHLLIYVMPTDAYRVYKAHIMKYDAEMMWKVAANCFYLSDEGGRPRDAEEENMLHSLMVEGFSLANHYINQTGDMSHFPNWFSHLSPIRIYNLSEQVEQSMQPRYANLLHNLDDALDKQLELLKTWFDNDAEGCLNYFGTGRAKQLLEVVDDVHVLYVTNRLTQLQNNPLAKELLQTINSEKI